GELARLDRRQDLFATLVEAGLALEARVDGSGRLLAGAAGHEEDDRVVLRELQALERRAVACAELWAGSEEERDVGAECRSELVHLRVGKRLRQHFVREQ